MMGGGSIITNQVAPKTPDNPLPNAHNARTLAFTNTRTQNHLYERLRELGTQAYFLIIPNVHKCSGVI